MVNDLIRQALHPYPENLKLATKVGARRDEAGEVLPAQRPDELREGVEANLRSLRVERLDLVNLRLVGGGRRRVRLEEQLLALEDMRREGKLDLIGLSNVDRATGAACAGARRRRRDPKRLQHHRSAGRRDGRPRRERDIAFVPFVPLGSSFMGGPARLAGDMAIVAVADKLGATPTQIALAWLLARYDRMLLIPGHQLDRHLEENMAATELELDDGDLAALDRVEQRDSGAE